MAVQFAKSSAARQVEARGRARSNGVRVEVIEHARYYQTHSKSRPGLVHHIGRTAKGWTCTCEGYTYTGMCQHIGQVERRSEREGWQFGRIARNA